MQSVRVRLNFFIILLILALTACVAQNDLAPTGTYLPPPGVYVTSKAFTQPTITPISTPTLLLSNSQAEKPAYHVCSPLEIHPLEELPEIISDPYHPPPMGKDERHQGVDFSYYQRGERSSIQGVGVQSILAGKVAASIPNSFPFGNLVIVETPGSDLPDWLRFQLGITASESLYVMYAHLDETPLVSRGQSIQQCQLIGKVGKSGNAGIAHLHLETRIGPYGSFFSTMAYYLADTTPEERDNYVLWRMSGVFRHFDPMRLLVPILSP